MRQLTERQKVVTVVAGLLMAIEEASSGRDNKGFYDGIDAAVIRAERIVDVVLRYESGAERGAL